MEVLRKEDFLGGSIVFGVLILEEIMWIGLLMKD